MGASCARRGVRGGGLIYTETDGGNQRARITGLQRTSRAAKTRGGNGELAVASV